MIEGLSAGVLLKMIDKAAAGNVPTDLMSFARLFIPVAEAAEVAAGSSPWYRQRWF